MKCIKCDKEAASGSSLCPECAAEEQTSTQSSITPGSLIPRTVAYLLDSALLQLLSTAIIVSIPGITGRLDPSIITKRIPGPLAQFLAVAHEAIIIVAVLVIASLLSCVLGLLWYVLFEVAWGATPGKKILGLAVVSMGRQRCGLFEVAARYLARFLWIVPLTVGAGLHIYLGKTAQGLIYACYGLSLFLSAVTYAPIFTSASRRGVHDLLSNCIVVQNQPTSPIASLLALILTFALSGAVNFVAAVPQSHPLPQGALEELVPVQEVLQPPPELLDLDKIPTVAPSPASTGQEAIPDLVAQVGEQEFKFSSAVAALSKDRKGIEVGLFDRRLTPDEIASFASLPFDSPKAPVQAKAVLGLNFMARVQTFCRFEEVRFFTINLPEPRGSGYLTFTRIGNASSRSEIAAITCDKTGDVLRFVAAFKGASAYRFPNGETVNTSWDFSFTTPLIERTAEVELVGHRSF